MLKCSLVLLFLAIGACSSKEKAVNDSSVSYVPVMMLQSAADASDSIGRAPSSAIEGKLLLQQGIPTPLTFVQLGLYKKQNDSWTEVAKLSTEQGGVFRFTQKLTRGKFELRVLSSKYHGTLQVTLDEEPLRSLVFYAEEK